MASHISNSLRPPLDLWWMETVPSLGRENRKHCALSGDCSRLANFNWPQRRIRDEWHWRAGGRSQPSSLIPRQTTKTQGRYTYLPIPQMHSDICRHQRGHDPTSRVHESERSSIPSKARAALCFAPRKRNGPRHVTTFVRDTRARSFGYLRKK